MPPWGRPPQGRRERERWERERMMYDDAVRFQELDDSEDERLSNHGVPASVFKQSNRSVSDELFFNDGASRYPRQSYSDEHLAYGDRYYSPEEDSGGSDEGCRRPSKELVRRDSDQMIAQRALDRIDRAKAKGNNSVSLTHEEIQALEKRYRRSNSDRDSPERKRRGSGDKAKKGQSPGAWTRKRNSRASSIIASSSTALAPAKPKAAVKETRKKQAQPPEDAFQHGQMPPGFMTLGPGGVPVYTPMGYYNAPPPPGRRTASDGTRYSPPKSADSSRSTSSSSRRGQPVYDAPPYPTRGNSGGSRSSQYVEPEYWPPPYGQPPYPQYAPYNPNDSRRVASGPPNIAYSNVYRRVPPETSARRPRMAPNSSDPALHYNERGPSGLGNEYEPSSATSEDDDDDTEEDELNRDPTYVEERRETRETTRRPVTAAASAGPSSRARRRR